jgi:hypothetical protein
VRDKKESWVLAAISPAFSKMDIDLWNSTHNNTNLNEAAHHNINIDGKSLSLLSAINM